MRDFDAERCFYLCLIQYGICRTVRLRRIFCRVFAGLFLTAVTLAGAAVIGVIGGAALLIQSLPDGLATLGFSLCCGAVGIMSVYGIFCFLKWLLYKVAQLLGKIMKGGKKNEKNN